MHYVINLIILLQKKYYKIKKLLVTKIVTIINKKS